MPDGIIIPTVRVGVLATDGRAMEFALTTLFSSAEARHHQRSLDSSARDGCTMTIVAGTNGKTTIKCLQLVIANDERELKACDYKVLGCGHRKGNLPMHGHTNGRRLLRAEGLPIMLSDEEISTRRYTVIFDRSKETFLHAAADLVDFVMQGARKTVPLYREVLVPVSLRAGGPEEITKRLPKFPFGVKIREVVVAA